MGTEEQTILENKYSIYGKPAGPGPIDLRIVYNSVYVKNHEPAFKF